MKYIIFASTFNQNKGLNKEEIEKCLELLEMYEDFKPEKWGYDERVKLKYSKEEIFDCLDNGKIIGEFCLYGNKKTKYQAYLDTSSRWSCCDFETRVISKDLLKKYFEITDKIAEIVKPRYGVCHIYIKKNVPWQNELDKEIHWMNSCGNCVPINFQKKGVLGAATRTYFSGNILDMLGKEFLINTPAFVTETSWGGVRIDLVEEPWNATVDELLVAWRKVMAYLNKTDLIAMPKFSERGTLVSFRPNIGWTEYLRTL